MKALVIYASNSGSNYTAAEIIHNILKEAGHKASFQSAAESKPEDLDQADLIVMGSTSWLVDGKEGMPHETMVEFMEKCQDKKMSDKKFAIFGCGDSDYFHFCGAVDHLEDFAKSLKGQLVTDSLKIDNFFYAVDQNSQTVKDWAQSLI